jgi:hypothetical protein
MGSGQWFRMLRADLECKGLSREIDEKQQTREKA